MGQKSATVTPHPPYFAMVRVGWSQQDFQDDQFVVVAVPSLTRREGGPSHQITSTPRSPLTQFESSHCHLTLPSD